MAKSTVHGTESARPGRATYGDYANGRITCKEATGNGIAPVHPNLPAFGLARRSAPRRLVPPPAG